jgi:hypothetical protein
MTSIFTVSRELAFNCTNILLKSNIYSVLARGMSGLFSTSGRA